MQRSGFLTLSLVAVVLACGTSVPEGWKELVPTEGLSKALELEPMALPGEGSADSLLAFYSREKVDASTLRQAFRDKIEAAGYTRIFECPEAPSDAGKDAPSDGYGKGPKGYVEVSIVPLTDEDWDVRVTKTDKLISIELPERADCKWLPEAADYCVGGMPSSSCETK
ncbi:hypothetical protein ACNOYE_03475 [Nannocystaceae bacterium ST9]